MDMGLGHQHPQRPLTSLSPREVNGFINHLLHVANRAVTEANDQPGAPFMTLDDFAAAVLTPAAFVDNARTIYDADPEVWQTWSTALQRLRTYAATGLTAAEAVHRVRSSRWNPRQTKPVRSMAALQHLCTAAGTSIDEQEKKLLFTTSCRTPVFPAYSRTPSMRSTASTTPFLGTIPAFPSTPSSNAPRWRCAPSTATPTLAPPATRARRRLSRRSPTTHSTTTPTRAVPYVVPTRPVRTRSPVATTAVVTRLLAAIMTVAATLMIVAAVTNAALPASAATTARARQGPATLADRPTTPITRP
ncbi:hypothetical protein HDU96_001333 [Phlyctochytrium bullatum]|nr:hypothetical protein HDU96_001333 [Phlyctochytrium bullatum]